MGTDVSQDVQQDVAEDASPALVGLGGRLRERRQEVGLSLREFARRIDVSASLISQIETGKVRPSVATLYAIVNELGGTVDELLFGPSATPTDDDGPEGSGRTVVERLRDHPAVPAVQRADERSVLQLSSGVRWERLTSESVPGIEFLYVVYEPGGESSPADGFQRHSGREWGYIISGTLHVTVAFDDHVLEPGDSVTFDSTTPHRLHNPGDVPVHAIWFVLGRDSGRG